MLPSLLVLCAVAAGLDALARWPGVAVRIGVALVFLSAFADMSYANHDWGRLESAVPPWSDAVASAQLSCGAQGGGTVRVAQLPQGWATTLPCSALTP